MTTAATTLTQVLYEETCEHNIDESAISHVPLGQLLDQLDDGASYAAVDNSGSTAGTHLRVAEAFVRALQVRQISLWNSTCAPPAPLQRIQWHSTGGTQPESVFQPSCHVPYHASCFVFMTDGEVGSTTELAKHATVTSYLPSLFVLFRDSSWNDNESRELVNSYNVSVVMAHHTAARTSAVLVVNNLAATGRLIAVKGDWETALPQPPPLTNDLRVCECPVATVEHLRTLPSRVYTRTVTGTMPISDNRVLNLDAMLLLPDGRELLTRLNDGEVEDVARAYMVQGRLPAWRAQLNHWLIQLEQEAAEQVQVQTQQASDSVHALLRRVRVASPQEADEQLLLSQLQEAVRQGVLQAQESSNQARQSIRRPRSIIHTALASVTALELSGMNATSLDRGLSNRSGRAARIDPSTLVPLNSLDTTGAPQEEDLILHETGPVALCLRAMNETDHNTSDDAINESLRAGQALENAVFEPTIVAMEMADRIESMDASPLTRELLSVCLPIVSLQNSANRKAVYHRLCIVFMNQLSMRHVWLIALSSMLRTIETQEWADPVSTPTGRLLQWFAGQIMGYVILPAGARLSPDASRPINEAFVLASRCEIMTIHSSLSEASVLLRLLHRFRASAAISNENLLQSFRARIAVAVPQAHRVWLQSHAADPWADQGAASLSALVSSLYDTRVDARGAHVAITGTGRLVERLDMMFSPPTLAAIMAFARALDVSMESLVTPGLTVVVATTLERVTSPHVSSTAAVQLVRSANAAAASEMEPLTVGIVGAEDALDVVRRRLAWARTPLVPMAPFATPFGPSVFWFYASDGTVVNMMEGFEQRPARSDEEPREEFLVRLTEYLRMARGRLMARYFGTASTGQLISGTITLPLYREMADEYNENAAGRDLTQSETVATFVHSVTQRIVGRHGSSAGNVHIENLEHRIGMLVPSLLNAVESFPGVDVRAEPRPIPLILRVELELREQWSVDTVTLGQPLSAVWVPDDDPELLRVLVETQRMQEVARVTALRRRAHNRATVAPTLPPSSVATLAAPDLVRFSRRLTWYLRHGAQSTRPDGFVLIRDMLEDPALRAGGVTVDNVLELCEKDTKGRFAVRDENGALFIRATQGHSLASVDLEQLMTPIESAAEVPVAVHGTYMDALRNIVRSGGLNRMSRQAIQMAVGMPDDPEVRSGIRRSVEVLIYVDVGRAMSQGLPFFRPENNVICCPGPIPLDCFVVVVQRDGSIIDLNSIGNT
jgi:RNA:NAD 2'-phosphotransferase (TPT1/KptA family)